MEIALLGFYVILSSVVGAAISLNLLMMNDEKAEKYLIWSGKLFLAGIIIWGYGNVQFILN